MHRVTKKLLSENDLSKKSYAELMAKAADLGRQAFIDGKSSASAQSSQMTTLLFPKGGKAFTCNILCNLMESYSSSWMVLQREASDRELRATGFYPAIRIPVLSGRGVCQQ
jgi:hypothetical protein